jgi:hypothetical protein
MREATPPLPNTPSWSGSQLKKRRENVAFTFCDIFFQQSSRYSAGLRAGRSGFLGFDSRRRLEIFLFTTASRTALGPAQPPIQWVPGALSLGVKRPGREADHSPPSNAEVNECVELYLHYHNTSSWRDA